MSTLSTTRYQSDFLSVLWQRLWNSNRFLAVSTVLYLALFVATLAALVVDSRLITGAPAWLKPMKFAISTMLYCATLAWLLSYVQGRRWLVGTIGAVTAVGFFVELVIIVLQAARGVRSHFNMSTPLDSTLFNVMGMFVILIWLMNILAAVLIIRQDLPDKAFAWAIRLGVVITAVGAGVGYFMLQPTPDQLVEMQAGQFPAIVGAHSVGVEDGGPGLPVTGWSTEGGDVRIPHFVGLHALQILPLAGILINRRWRNKLSEKRRTALVWTVSLGYLGLVLLLLWQALRGQSIIAPDVTTLQAVGGWLTIVVASGTAILRARRP